MAPDYVILHGPMRTAFCVVDFIEGFADDYKLMRGHAVSAEWPRNVRFRMSPDFKQRSALSDNIVNSNKFLVASQRLQDFLVGQGVPDIELLPVAIVNHKKKAEPAPYAIVNPIGTQDCVDRTASELVMNTINPAYISIVKRLVIDARRIDPAAQLFRGRGLGTIVFFRRDLADKLLAAGFTGIEFLEIAKYKT